MPGAPRDARDLAEVEERPQGRGPRSRGPDRHRLWPARLLLVAYAAALAAWPSLSRPVPAEAARWRPQDPVTLLSWLGELAASAALEVLVLAPLGLLAVLSLRPRGGRLLRVALVAGPALLVALAAGVAVAVLSAGLAPSSPSPLVLCALAVAAPLGVWAGMCWRRGPLAMLGYVVKLGVLLAALALAGGLLAWRAAEEQALDFVPQRVTSAEKKRLHELFRGKHPKGIPEGETRSLRLSRRDLDQLVSWGLSLGAPEHKARIELTDGVATIRASVGLPLRRLKRRFFNVTVSAGLAVSDGRPQVAADALRIGDVAAPDWLLDLSSALLGRGLAGSERARTSLSSVRDLVLHPEGLEVTFGRGEIPPGFLASLFQEQQPDEVLAPRVKAHALNLVRAAEHLPQGTSRFGAALETAFAFASKRSREEGAVEENQAAIVALGMLLGHWRVEQLVGPVLDEHSRKQGLAAFRGTTLYGRADLCQHYLVSASLAVLSGAPLGDAVGVLKEELDAHGESGFSFADLLADRAGTRLAETAAADEASARRMQHRLARGFVLADFFPDPSGLPDAIPDAELIANYGGVDGSGYRQLVAEIDRRLAGCAAYGATRLPPAAEEVGEGGGLRPAPSEPTPP